MERPANILDWLTNVKLALDSGHFLQEHFLQPAQLMEVFAAEECPPFRRRGNSESEFAELSGFDSVLAPYTKEERLVPAMGLRIDKTLRDKGVLSETSLRFEFQRDESGKLPELLAFENFVTIFGKDSTRSTERFAASSQVFFTAKHPMGNETIIYHWQGLLAQNTLRLELAFDGKLLRGEATQTVLQP